MKKPWVAVIIGSKTDQSILEESGIFAVLKDCGVKYEASIISADRNPGRLSDYCAQALQDGVKIFIAGAGMAARLPGSIAAHTKYLIPVIGVALPSEEFPNALDSLLSIIRSPSGCPLIFAGIGKAGFKNAAIAAAQILASGEDDESKKIKDKLITFILNNKKEPVLGFRKSG